MQAVLHRLIKVDTQIDQQYNINTIGMESCITSVQF